MQTQSKLIEVYDITTTCYATAKLDESKFLVNKHKSKLTDGSFTMLLCNRCRS